MKITFGSRELRVPTPSIDELQRIGGFERVPEEARAKLLAIYEAGAKAALREVENGRGARMEAALLKD